MNAPATILVVDDNPTNLKLAISVLECDGFTVLSAHDAAETEAHLQRLKPDLILMDLQMPGVDGLTLSRRLKANPEYQAIPIIALTAFAMKGDENRALDAGCAGYITKPIDTRRLASQIAGILRQTSDRANPP